MAMEQKESKSNLIADYYSQHYDELMTYVSSHLQHADESEDIVQNIFVRLLQMDKMITPVTLPCLVFTIAKNLIRDYWRHYYYLEEHEHIQGRLLEVEERGYGEYLLSERNQRVLGTWHC